MIAVSIADVIAIWLLRLMNIVTRRLLRITRAISESIRSNNATLKWSQDGAGPFDAAIPADTNKTDGYLIQWSRKLTGTGAQVLLRWLSTSTVHCATGSCEALQHFVVWAYGLVSVLLRS